MGRYNEINQIRAYTEKMQCNHNTATYTITRTDLQTGLTCSAEIDRDCTVEQLDAISESVRMQLTRMLQQKPMPLPEPIESASKLISSLKNYGIDTQGEVKRRFRRLLNYWS